MKKSSLQWIYMENQNFKKFKKGDRLKNHIFLKITKKEKTIYIVSTKLKQHKYSYKISFSLDFKTSDLEKFINILKHDTTWTISNQCALKNSEHLSLNQVLKKHSLDFKFKISLIKTPNNILVLISNKELEVKKENNQTKLSLVNQRVNHQISFFD